MKFKTILALLAACLTACNDDFFDQVPDDRITIEQVFQRTSYSEKYLATVYSYIRDESHRTDGVPWDPCSDDLDVTYDREDYNSFKMNLGNWSASSNYYEYWSHYYRGIRSATYFIQHIGSNQEMLDDPTRGPIVVEQYKNEARFLRAWFYYCLLRQYGPCVLLGDEVLPGDLDRDDVKMNLPRSLAYDECVDYIVGELDDMIDNERLPLHFTVQADKTTAGRHWPCAWDSKAAYCCWPPATSSTATRPTPTWSTRTANTFSTRERSRKWNGRPRLRKGDHRPEHFRPLQGVPHRRNARPLPVLPQRFPGELEQRGDDGPHQQLFKTGSGRRRPGSSAATKAWGRPSNWSTLSA